jgi:hypothetical protein
MDYPAPRLNEKRGHVSIETIKDRRELAERLAGAEEKIALLKPMLRIRFAPRPLKKALLQYLTLVGLRQGGNSVPRLSVRHVDGLVELFTRWCPVETELALASRHAAAEPPVLQNPPLPFPAPFAAARPTPADNPAEDFPFFDIGPGDDPGWDFLNDKEFPFVL